MTKAAVVPAAAFVRKGMTMRESLFRRLSLAASVPALALALLAAASPAAADSNVYFGVGVGGHRHHDYGYGYGGSYYRHSSRPPDIYYPPPAVIYEQPPAVVYAPPRRQDQLCREYQSSAVIDGRKQPTYGTACRQPDGSWRIIN
jgi:hypothetical protein